MSKLDRILRALSDVYTEKRDIDFDDEPDRKITKQHIKNLMLSTYLDAVSAKGSVTDNFIKEVGDL